MGKFFSVCTAYITIERMTNQKKHGGCRKKLTWEDKLTIVEPANVNNFVNSVDFVCKCDCMLKLRKLEQTGHSVITKLRESRLTGVM